ncbi:hypothetical protein HMPREF9123_2439 [Neisseria bacilliformis ATCC BAA-1200]|uniref:Uncharacterized protein n=1 Tax=Neisseria bacilliformis ATCC BAA-1200 TaxID=888742 RepID=F2BFD2_9NEIS|nr:hypothetical protein HMPREF9123_2439 [Neisseria bacilliformis ATCC BAA-1200]
MNDARQKGRLKTCKTGFQTALNLCASLDASQQRHSRAGGNLVGILARVCFFKIYSNSAKIPACAGMTAFSDVWL